MDAYKIDFIEKLSQKKKKVKRKDTLTNFQNSLSFTLYPSRTS